MFLGIRGKCSNYPPAQFMVMEVKHKIILHETLTIKHNLMVRFNPLTEDNVFFISHSHLV